jgi:hypothetical protein
MGLTPGESDATPAQFPRGLILVFNVSWRTIIPQSPSKLASLSKDGWFGSIQTAIKK